MEKLLPLFILLPVTGYFLSLLMPRRNEKMLAFTGIGLAAIQFAGSLAFTFFWMLRGFPDLELKYFVIYQTSGFEFFIDFCFDKITAIYLLTGSAISLLVIIFSRFYIHREEGFKRFFNTVLFFFLGYNIVIFAGNFETLFIGWEFLGISSFLLISFYRDRYLPVKNSLKVISVYRLGDVCLMLAMWMSHHIWHGNVTFANLNHAGTVALHISEHYGAVAFIAVMILIAAATKSAQLPFSSWLARAMEGPTSSSAIFYGSLAVHLGVFLLLRTAPFWENILPVKIIIVSLGLATSLVATSIARVQSTVKTQIAYSSIAQMGIIFMEIGFGFHYLALIHFSANAFLRTYQLLVSPSVLHYLVHHQFFNFIPKPKSGSQLNKLAATIYLLSVKEWNIDSFLYRVFWNPFKFIGKRLKFIGSLPGGIVIALIFIAGTVLLIYEIELHEHITDILPLVFSATGFIMILRAFTERQNAIRAWLLVIGSQFFVALTISHNSNINAEHLMLFLSGVVLSGITGFICLNKIKRTEEGIDLNKFHGHVYEYPRTALLFLLSCLGLLGFPVTSTFIGIDLFFTHIDHDQYALITFIALSVALIELSVLRIYARIFLGQHQKAYHPIAYRSS